MRVNARLNGETQIKINYLTQATGQSVSDVVREAIGVYHAQVRKQRAMPSKLLAMAGTGDSGRSDISSNIKKYVMEILEAKHGLSKRRVPE
jgi:hypothetical protein